MSADRLRCFIALDLDREVRSALADLTEPWARSGANVRWTPAGNLHLTLKFLGSIEPGQLADIEAACRRACASHPSFSFTVRGVGAFPNLRRPRVLWAGIDGDDVGELAAAIDRELAPLGFPGENRRYRPHLTLGRLRSDRGWSDLRPLVSAAEDNLFGSCKALAATALRSDLRPDGAVYTKLWTAELQPPSSR